VREEGDLIQISITKLVKCFRGDNSIVCIKTSKIKKSYYFKDEVLSPHLPEGNEETQDKRRLG
jgi:hypothetical protein